MACGGGAYRSEKEAILMHQLAGDLGQVAPPLRLAQTPAAELLQGSNLELCST